MGSPSESCNAFDCLYSEIAHIWLSAKFIPTGWPRTRVTTKPKLPFRETPSEGNKKRQIQSLVNTTLKESNRPAIAGVVKCSRLRPEFRVASILKEQMCARISSLRCVTLQDTL